MEPAKVLKVPFVKYVGMGAITGLMSYKTKSDLYYPEMWKSMFQIETLKHRTGFKIVAICKKGLKKTLLV